MRSVRWFATILLTAWTGLFSPVWGLELHVNPVDGFDGNDGLAATTQTRLTGPVKTLRRAMQLARAGDTVVLANIGQPYYEPLRLVGGPHSGFESQPFTIRGNGATLSGMRPVPPDGWQSEGDGVWRLSLTRKGYYRFFRGDDAIPEFLPTAANTAINDLPFDHYLSRQGAVLFRFDQQTTPYSQSWTYAAEDTGISLVDVRNVRLVDLNVTGFRVDGANADGNCRGVVFDNVTIHDNGRAGLSANGTSRVIVQNSRLTANGRHAVLITEFAQVTLTDSDLGGEEPVVE
jgi:hypothetical protein